jgi:amino acid transporter
MTTEADPAREHGLRRELRFWEAIALSIGIMAPGAAMALNGTLPASLVGRAVPLAFIFASVGILFVSYAFIRLTGYFNHAGSVYALSGVTLGPRAGFFSGWVLLGTYLSFTAASTAEVGLFGQAFFDGTGIWPNAEWLLILLVAAALIWFIAYGDIKVATRAAEYGGAYCHADRDRGRGHLRQGVRWHGSERSELHALPLHAAKRSGVGYCRPGRGLRASLVRGFRGGSLSR